IQYLPYKMNTALHFVERIAKGMAPGFVMTSQVKDMYMELIRYYQGDPDFKGDLNKGILLMGTTGSGKTLAMKVMDNYRKIDNISYLKNGRRYTMNYDIMTVHEVVKHFMAGGYDRINPYENRFILCLDDIGAEVERVKHYGTDVDIIGDLLTSRCKEGLLTFATTNFPMETLEEKYNDRVVSRMHEMFNFLTIRDQDFRRN
ncbi:MAG: hypothetical protein KFF49_04175, partial [Bacteroidales bacterium]|nr:hypothetical protein [Bacteroidales bacterium]